VNETNKAVAAVDVRHITQAMEIEVTIHKAEEGGFWADVTSIPGCATQGDTLQELVHNLGEAIEGCLSNDDVKECGFHG